MSATADALQPQIVSGLMRLDRVDQIRYFSDVIIHAPRTGYDLDFVAEPLSIRIDFREASFLASALGGDATRFAAAAFSSFKSIPAAVDDAASLAWGLVRAYYAAFYGGHATLRFFGRSCTYLESRHVSHIRQLANALGNLPNSSISAGLYSGSLNLNQTGVELTQAAGRVGGAHEIFWEIFDLFLSESTEEVLLSRVAPSDARAVFLKLEALRKITRRGAGSSWLSFVRNEIQYKHARDVWIPNTINRTQRGILSRLAGQWVRDPLSIDLELPPAGDLGAFVAACAFIVALCREILTRIADRSTAGANSFARRPLAICI